MKLSELLKALPGAEASGRAEVEVAGLAYDSRKVEQGFAFVAIPGTNVDGHDYTRQALERGASVLVCQRALNAARATLLLVEDTRRALADLAAAFYGYPGRELTTIGVTGTDGKTSTCYLLAHVLQANGRPSGLATSVGFRVGTREWFNDTRQTTQESLEIQGLLRQMVDAGVRFAAIEATSHGLSELEDCVDRRMYVGRRLLHCDFDVGVLTNLGRDHLDYHGSVERYRQAKARLFREAASAVLNADDAECSFFRAACRGPVRLYGVANPAALQALEVRQEPNGLRFTVREGERQAQARLPMYGRHNVDNALAAAAVARGLGIELEPACQALSSFAGIPGRMEEIDEGQAFRVFVDYAHTPQAFSGVLATAREIGRGRVLAVFGCSGERDPSKRQMMGEMAARSCEYFCITDEDPHREDPAAIAAEIEAGCRQLGAERGERYDVDLDRGSAMERAFRRAQPADVVLVTGKGHERCMLVGTGRVDWDDREVARERLRELVGRSRATARAPG